MCAVQCVFGTEPGFCVKVLRAGCVFGNGCLRWEVLSEPVLMCKTLECILCKYIPAVKRDLRAVYAVREHMPFDGLCSQDSLKQNKPWVRFKSRDSFGSLCTQQALMYLSNE